MPSSASVLLSKVDRNYSDYRWMDNQGNIVGTKTADSPGVGWRQMIDLP